MLRKRRISVEITCGWAESNGFCSSPANHNEQQGTSHQHNLGNQLTSVYRCETGVRMLRELSQSYLTIVKDLSRVMNRLKAVYRSWAIPCAGRDVYYTRHRAEWLGKIREAGVRRRAEQLYQRLDMLQHLRQHARRELLAESRKHPITAQLRQIPSVWERT
jgi:hypothetical protein